MTWIVDIPEKPDRHRCNLPKGAGLEAHRVGSIWECDRCYAQYELKILNVAGHNKKVMVRK